MITSLPNESVKQIVKPLSMACKTCEDNVFLSPDHGRKQYVFGEYYHCETCNDGDVFVDREYFSKGDHCPVNYHQMTQRFAAAEIEIKAHEEDIRNYVSWTILNEETVSLRPQVA